jgi:SAM-dependent methyltransferase
MVPGILDFAKRMRQAHAIEPGNVLEVGSYNVNGTIRDVFQAGAASYLGVDMAPGPGVDVVMNAHDIAYNFRPSAFDTILCCETLEHDLRPWITVGHMRSLLKPGGHLLVTTPTFGFPEHRYPIDCYRYGEDAYRGFIFEGYEVLGLEKLAPDPIICCIGRKPR